MDRSEHWSEQRRAPIGQFQQTKQSFSLVNFICCIQICIHIICNKCIRIHTYDMLYFNVPFYSLPRTSWSQRSIKGCTDGQYRTSCMMKSHFRTALVKVLPATVRWPIQPNYFQTPINL